MKTWAFLPLLIACLSTKQKLLDAFEYSPKDGCFDPKKEFWLKKSGNVHCAKKDQDQKIETQIIQFCKAYREHCKQPSANKTLLVAKRDHHTYAHMHMHAHLSLDVALSHHSMNSASNSRSSAEPNERTTERSNEGATGRLISTTTGLRTRGTTEPPTQESIRSTTATPIERSTEQTTKGSTEKTTGELTPETTKPLTAGTTERSTKGTTGRTTEEISEGPNDKTTTTKYPNGETTKLPGPQFVKTLSIPESECNFIDTNGTEVWWSERLKLCFVVPEIESGCKELHSHFKVPSIWSSSRKFCYIFERDPYSFTSVKCCEASCSRKDFLMSCPVHIEV